MVGAGKERLENVGAGAEDEEVDGERTVLRKAEARGEVRTCKGSSTKSWANVRLFAARLKYHKQMKVSASLRSINCHQLTFEHGTCPTYAQPSTQEIAGKP